MGSATSELPSQRTPLADAAETGLKIGQKEAEPIKAAGAGAR